MARGAALRASTYAKASVIAEASAYAKATAAALCARTVKSADKYDPSSRLRASAFAEPTAAARVRWGSICAARA